MPTLPSVVADEFLFSRSGKNTDKVLEERQDSRLFFPPKSRLALQSGKGGLEAGGPDGQDVRGVQGGMGGAQPAPGIESDAAGAGQAIGTVVHVEHDGVTNLLFRF